MTDSAERGNGPMATVNARLAPLGLDPTMVDVRRRIPVRPEDEGAGPAAVPERPLPQISVDLRLPERVSEGGEGRDDPATDLEVTALLGQGGMGRVLLARQHSLDREVAIKTLHDAPSRSDRNALISEGAITGHLEHPSIIPVHALGHDANGQPVLVMKRVVGVEWADLVDHPDHEAWEDDGRDRLEAHLEILMQVCNAAHFAHSRGIVHRDIKPQNVLIGHFGEVYLSDWGLAVRMGGGDTEPLCGTPSYMAPEMVVGGPVDARTDVFLLGATLHRILTGEPRNPGTLHEALANAIEIEPFAYPASVPRELAIIANRATALDPADRHADAHALRQDLADYLRHRSSIALAASAAERLARLRSLAADRAALTSEARQREIDVLGAELRFALDQALREWPENPVARRAAAELEQMHDARLARTAALERRARELDPRIAQGPRAVGIALLAVAGLAVSAYGLVHDSTTLTARSLFWQSLGPFAMGWLSIALLRRHLLRTSFNRRATIAALAMVSGITISRALGIEMGESVARILVHDLLLASLMCVIGATVIFRWLAWIAAGLLAAAVAAAAAPARAALIFFLASGLAVVTAAGIAARAALRRT